MSQNRRIEVAPADIFYAREILHLIVQELNEEFDNIEWANAKRRLSAEKFLCHMDEVLILLMQYLSVSEYDEFGAYVLRTYAFSIDEVSTVDAGEGGARRQNSKEHFVFVSKPKFFNALGRLMAFMEGREFPEDSQDLLVEIDKARDYFNPLMLEHVVSDLTNLFTTTQVKMFDVPELCKDVEIDLWNY